MDQPDGFADKQHHDKKCLLKKICMVQSKRHENGIIVSTHTLKAKDLRVRLLIFVSMCDDRMLISVL